MLRVIFFVTISLFCLNQSRGQAEFNGSFGFLKIPLSTRQAGMGGMIVSLANTDVNLLVSNPALVGESLNGNLGINYIGYPGDINISSLSYVTNVGSYGPWGASLSYFNYGDINGYDPTGSPTGTFRAREYAFTINKTHQIGNYRLGVNLKYLYSGIAGNAASAIGVDLGGVYIHPELDWTAALVIGNLGIIVSDYTGQIGSSIPLNVSIGTSYKPAYMPVRFSLTLTDLSNWEGLDAKNEETGIENPVGMDNFFQHAQIGTQFLIGKHIELLLGYNYKRRKELKISSAGGGSGFTYGILIGISAFEFGFSRGNYALGGASNTFTLIADMGKIVRKRSTTDLNL